MSSGASVSLWVAVIKNRHQKAAALTPSGPAKKQTLKDEDDKVLWSPVIPSGTSRGNGSPPLAAL